MGVVDPKRVAGAFGIGVCGLRGVSFRLATTETVIIYGWNSDPTVRHSLIWEGIARCLLTRCGANWTDEMACAFALLLAHSQRKPS